MVLCVYVHMYSLFLCFFHSFFVVVVVVVWLSFYFSHSQIQCAMQRIALFSSMSSTWTQNSALPLIPFLFFFLIFFLSLSFVYSSLYSGTFEMLAIFIESTLISLRFKCFVQSNILHTDWSIMNLSLAHVTVIIGCVTLCSSNDFIGWRVCFVLCVCVCFQINCLTFVLVF